jgi:hypothetical protein
MTEQDRAVADASTETEVSDKAMTKQDHAVADAPTDTEVSDTATLFGAEDVERFRSRWLEVQTRFVDEPQRSVEEASALVAEVIQKLTAVFGDQQKELKGQTGGSGKLSTEDLRVALRRYRAFFDGLLKA